MYAVYILANRANGTLYIGVTNNLKRRIYEHKQNVVPGFTQKYHVHMLVYFEVYDDVQRAIVREKRMKEWKRVWKVDLIQQKNPLWNDLYESL
jgi:putative endonuclease